MSPKIAKGGGKGKRGLDSAVSGNPPPSIVYPKPLSGPRKVGHRYGDGHGDCIAIDPGR